MLAEAEVPILWLPDSKSWFTGKDPDVGKNWRQKEKEATEEEVIDGITNTMNMNLSKLWEILDNRGAWRAAVHGVAKSQTQLSDWKTATVFCHRCPSHATNSRLNVSKYNTIVKGPDCLNSTLRHLWAVWPWVGCNTSLCDSFICTMEVIMISIL